MRQPEAMHPPRFAPMLERRSFVALLFLLSGAAALIYQMAWQRLLFAIFGVDTDSVAVVVSVFMLGLGLGALLGGTLADRVGTKAIVAFAAIEIAIGAFGVASPLLIGLLDAGLAGSGRLATGLWSFLLLAVPTTLMGATLPILVAWLTARVLHVGGAVGLLYVANTAGAAIGAAAAGFFLLNWLDLNQLVRLAAAINVTVGISAWLARRTE